ncbi:hypothetical protein [Sphingomonas humi]
MQDALDPVSPGPDVTATRSAIGRTAIIALAIVVAMVLGEQWFPAVRF